MNYGNMIKKTRTKLKLKQSDLADDNISRTLISDIENNKVKLVSSKAMLIYEKLIYQAYDKDARIRLDFDNILKNNEKYQKLKYGNEILNELNRTKIEGVKISRFKIEKYRLYAIRNEIGILKVYILMRLYDRVDNDLEYKVKLAFNALDYLKWQKFSETYEIYDKVLKLVTQQASKLGKYEELIYYYQYFESNAIEQKINIPTEVYFNLGLFCKKTDNYMESYKYINRYIDFTSNLSFKDKIDTLITLGNLSIKMQDIDRGIKYYEEVIDTLGPNGDIVLKSFAISNFVYNVSVFSIGSKFDEVKYYINELNENIQLLEEKLSNISIVYLYMGIAYEFIGDNKNSKKYKYLSLHSCQNSRDIIFALKKLIKESNTIDIKDIFIEKLCDVDVSDLSEECVLNYYELVFKVLTLEDLTSEKDAQIKSLIKKLGGE